VAFHVETTGTGPRVVLVHGSVGNGRSTWSVQLTLADRFELVVVDRSGYPPNPPLDRIDFDDQAVELAEVLRPGDHLVGHSYGGVVSLLAAGLVPDRLRSLTVVEPPALGVARGDRAADAFVAASAAFFAQGPHSPEDYVQTFLPLVGSAVTLPSPLPPVLEQGVRAAIAERPPWEAEIPLRTLAEAPFPKLVVSGAHHPAFDAVCDVLERELGAERAVLPGAGHTVQRAPGFNERLVAFLERAPWPPNTGV
jgi:pimeloyl-ACP methyl ester carboxylesterase